MLLYFFSPSSTVVATTPFYSVYHLGLLIRTLSLFISVLVNPLRVTGNVYRRFRG